MPIILNLFGKVLGQVFGNHAVFYPTPASISYFWSFGSIALVILVSQTITGIFLAMHFTANIYTSFSDVEHIMRDVVGGYGLRYLHANGASMFFIVVYTHMARGLYYGSYNEPRYHLWASGVVIFLLIMATAFMGYVLPWGQMSFWGATVITNLFSAIPQVGTSIVQLLWGGFAVDNPTLNRFFSLHFALPFILLGLSLLHLILLHEYGSNNPLGIDSVVEKVPFMFYFIIKDVFSIFAFSLLFAYFVVNLPDYLGHPDNYIEAQPLVTPTHIVPEWYFLPFYAILRAIPNKLAGVFSMFWSIAILLFLPWFDCSPYRSSFFKPFIVYCFIFFVLTMIILGWLGQAAVDYPFLQFSSFISFAYFIYFKIIGLDGVL